MKKQPIIRFNLCGVPHRVEISEVKYDKDYPIHAKWVNEEAGHNGKLTFAAGTTNEDVLKRVSDTAVTLLGAEKRWPELDAIAEPIFENVVRKINAIPINQIDTTMPYIRQCVLEMVISKLEAVV